MAYALEHKILPRLREMLSELENKLKFILPVRCVEGARRVLEYITPVMEAINMYEQIKLLIMETERVKGKLLQLYDICGIMPGVYNSVEGELKNLGAPSEALRKAVVDFIKDIKIQDYSLMGLEELTDKGVQIDEELVKEVKELIVFGHWARKMCRGLGPLSEVLREIISQRHLPISEIKVREFHRRILGRDPETEAELESFVEVLNEFVGSIIGKKLGKAEEGTYILK